MRKLLPWCVILGLLVLLLEEHSEHVAAQNFLVPGQSPGGGIGGIVGVEQGPLRREGDELRNTAGSFSWRGERLLFADNEGHQFILLENLMAQRIADSMADIGDRNAWTVDAMVTEYRGANYLLVNRATLKSDKKKVFSRR